jgi:hypothetical protein
MLLLSGVTEEQTMKVSEAMQFVGFSVQQTLNQTIQQQIRRLSDKLIS